MRPPSRERSHGLRFEITPLIDVVFLLIIFFLAASHFARSDEQVPEEIEHTRLDQPEDDEADAAAKRLVVTVTAGRTTYVRGEAVTSARVAELIAGGVADFGPDFEVRLRTDRRTPYEAVEPLLLACAQSNVRNLKFAVLERE